MMLAIILIRLAYLRVLCLSAFNSVVNVGARSVSIIYWPWQVSVCCCVVWYYYSDVSRVSVTIYDSQLRASDRSCLRSRREFSANHSRTSHLTSVTCHLLCNYRLPVLTHRGKCSPECCECRALPLSLDTQTMPIAGSCLAQKLNGAGLVLFCHRAAEHWCTVRQIIMR